MKVSIIIPVYNKIRYLRTILTQVKDQSFQDFECLLIDDGSADGSGAVCDEFAARDTRFRVFHISNGGVSHARNLGLQYSRGEYITFLDADDEITSEYVCSMCERLDNSCADMVISASCKFWDDSLKLEEIKVPYEGLIFAETFFAEFARNQYKSGIYGFCWGKMMRKVLLEGVEFDEKIRLAEDLDFYLSLYPKISSIYFEPTPLHRYRQEAENSSMLCRDCDIDYFAQLQIQHKMYRMLEGMGYLFEENKFLITKRIYDYVFFTLFHAPQDGVLSCARKIRQMSLPPIGDFSQRGWKQKFILAQFIYRTDRLLKFSTGMYKLIRG